MEAEMLVERVNKLKALGFTSFDFGFVKNGYVVSHWKYQEMPEEAWQDFVNAITDTDKVKKYMVAVTHDSGVTRITTTATSLVAAHVKVVAAENCPDRAISAITEL